MYIRLGNYVLTIKIRGFSHSYTVFKLNPLYMVICIFKLHIKIFNYGIKK